MEVPRLAAVDLGVELVQDAVGRLSAHLVLDRRQLLVGVDLRVGHLQHVHLGARNVEPGVVREIRLLGGGGRLANHHAERDARRDESACHADDEPQPRRVALLVGLVLDRLLDELVLGVAHLALRVALLLRDLDHQLHEGVEVEHGVALGARLHVGERLGRRGIHLRRGLLEGGYLVRRHLEPEARKLRDERVERGGIRRRRQLQVVRDHGDGSGGRALADGDGKRILTLRRRRLLDIADGREDGLPHLHRIDGIAVYLNAHWLIPF